MGWEDRLGTLEAGKLADVIVSREDPLANIESMKQVENIRFVMKDGTVFKNLL